MPIGKEENFQGMIDLIAMKALLYDESLGLAHFETGDIPDDLREEAEARREALLDAVSEFDDVLMEKYLDGEEIERRNLSAA